MPDKLELIIHLCIPLHLLAGCGVNALSAYTGHRTRSHDKTRQRRIRHAHRIARCSLNVLSVLQTGCSRKIERDRSASLIHLTPICEQITIRQFIRLFSNQLMFHKGQNPGISRVVAGSSAIISNVYLAAYCAQFCAPSLLVPGSAAKRVECVVRAGKEIGHFLLIHKKTALVYAL